ncbi:hypothetical protein SAMN05216259_102123 [Actinacidiphila guanduensis]|uniref:Uncharacterized protein n=1 Tax=Actinacidiphila guanduensis TaxID=310781 RepID=A0A1G9XGM7_9ACTN|nr:hypothetical protein SAMN05216259_102123 [Actinacidiphila guanduensis]
MSMTIAVYRIDATSGERITVRDRYDVRPATTPPPLTTALPPCDCERCRKGARSGAPRDKWGTVRSRA